MIACDTILTFTDSLPFPLTNRTEQIKRPVSRQASQPHIEIITEVIPCECRPWVCEELVIKESKDLCYIREPIGVFYLDISATQ